MQAVGTGDFFVVVISHIRGGPSSHNKAHSTPNKNTTKEVRAFISVSSYGTLRYEFVTAEKGGVRLIREKEKSPAALSAGESRDDALIFACREVAMICVASIGMTLAPHA